MRRVAEDGHVVAQPNAAPYRSFDALRIKFGKTSFDQRSHKDTE